MMIRKQGSLWDILDAGYSIFFLKELFLTQYSCLLSNPDIFSPFLHIFPVIAMQLFLIIMMIFTVLSRVVTWP